MLPEAIESLEETRKKMDSVYGPVAAESVHFNAHAGVGTLSEAKAFAGACAR